MYTKYEQALSYAREYPQRSYEEAIRIAAEYRQAGGTPGEARTIAWQMLSHTAYRKLIDYARGDEDRADWLIEQDIEAVLAE